MTVKTQELLFESGSIKSDAMKSKGESRISQRHENQLISSDFVYMCVDFFFYIDVELY